MSNKTRSTTNSTAEREPLARSGGPMAATVDKVLDRAGRPFGLTTVFSDMRRECPSVMKLIDAAIRRAAENAAGTKLVSPHGYRNNCETCKERADEIERHVRRELGL